MHKRLVSYVLFLATIVAVLMVVVIQPRNTVFRKTTIGPTDTYHADTSESCMMGNMTCEQYAAMMAASYACSTTGGTWNWTNNTCQAPPPMCGGVSCTQMTCEAAGYTWDAIGETCLINPVNNPSSGGDPVSVGGTSANERLSQRIESQCLAHVEKSGYEPVIRKYGWFNNVRIYANNACTYAYLATNGKFSSNNDLYLVADLVARDTAARKEDIGVLYAALENAPTQKSGQSLDDYLNPNKDGVAKYLKSVMDIMSGFNDTTTDQKLKPAYLVEPLPYVTEKAASAYNAAHGTKIVSLEEKLLALLPKPVEDAVEQPKEPAKELTEDIPPAPERPAIIKKAAEPAEEAPSMSQRVAVILTKIVNKLKGIREEGIERGIERKTVSPSLDALQKDFEYQQAVIKAFDEAHDSLCAKLGC